MDAGEARGAKALVAEPSAPETSAAQAFAEPYSHLEHANELEPAAGHHHLLQHCPFHREESHDPPFYVVSRHADVLAMLTDPELWNNRDGSGVFFQRGGVLGGADGDDHRRQRKVLQDGFRPTSIDALAPRVQQIADEIWAEAFGADGEGDFVHLFAFTFPAIVIAELLGVAAQDRERFGAWSNDIVSGLGLGGDPAKAEAANVGIYEIVDALAAERTSSIERGETVPDDMISVLTRAYLAGTLEYGELRRLCQQLLVAGHETTASLISFMLYRLIEQPALAAQLRDDSSLLDVAIEEFLRHESPVQGLFRTNARPCPLGDDVLEERTKVQVLFAAANRDPQVWEAPDEIRFDRKGKRQHLAFGWGTHHCIGAALARQEARVALRLMVERFDHVELIGAVAVNQPFVLRGLTTMPIRWTVR